MLYAWDSAAEHLQAIVELAPTGYYATQAEKYSTNIRKSHQFIQEQQRNYQNYRVLCEQTRTQENYDIAAQTLYDIAGSLA